jgi:hypothetical protein
MNTGDATGLRTGVAVGAPAYLTAAGLGWLCVPTGRGQA